MSNESKIVDLPSEAAPGAPYFTPKQEPRAGTAQDPQPDGKPLPLLFTPLKIRGMELHNRITLAPLCQYSAQDGFPTAWHMAHLGGIIKRGPGLSYTEATAVEPRGRISPEDTGIWSDEHVAAWKEIVTFAHSQNQKIGIQLAHAGRKAATVAPFINFGMAATKAVGGWPDDVVGPTSERFSDTFHTPRELTVPEIKGLVQAFKDAAVRGLKAGFDTMQIHNAHGYLLDSFISPHSNKRTDEYGGSFENRIRFTLEVVDAVREVIPEDMPLSLRISATDWLEESLPDEPSWRIEDTIKFAHILAEHGIDSIDISSGGNSPHQKIGIFGSHTQTLLAKKVKESFDAANQQVRGGGKALVSAVGSINTGTVAEQCLQDGRCDFVTVGRHFQKNPGAVWQFAEELDVTIYVAKQIGWGYGGRGTHVTRKVPGSKI
ncbi:NADH-dependent flavin oxidoreductase [Marasmius crinis-equi]|uniref:NADH-dependent flavin oxidoreductase n=1 Tax=Marasmius crinis-equi TaxID=585013 RepID=A0ABR3F0X4_9AGAR